MDHLHTNWKDRTAATLLDNAQRLRIKEWQESVNMGEAPEVTPQRNPAFDRAFEAMQAARQQAGLSPYAPPVGMGGQQDAMVRNYGRVLDIAMDLPAPVTRESLYLFLGRNWVSKVRKRQRAAGTYAAAKQLRKSGVGLAVAKLLLLGRV